MENNPYKSPLTPGSALPPSQQGLDLGVVIIALLLLGGFVASVAGLAFPSVGNFLRVRFGWIGLMLGLNALIFVAMCLKAPKAQSLWVAGSMTCLIGVLNAFVLLRSGTVDVVENHFHDRLHSSWLYAVATYFCAGGYLFFSAIRRRTNSEHESQ